MSEGMLGHGALEGAAEEVTWGTGVAASTHWLPIISSTLDVDVDIRDAPHLGFVNPQNFHNVRDHAPLGHDAGGDVLFVPRYDDKATALMFKHAFGAVATSGANPYDHTFALNRSQPTGLTFQQIYGQHSSLSRAEVFAGCLINTFELSCGARSFLQCKLGIIGKSGAGMAAVTGSPAATDSEEMLSQHSGDLTWNSESHGVMRQWALFIDKKFARRPIVGSIYTDRPQPSGMAEVVFRATLEWTSHSLYTALLAGTQGDGSIVVTGSGQNRLTINLANMVVRRCKKPIQNSGVHTFDVEMRCFASTTEQGVEMVLRNTHSTAI